MKLVEFMVDFFFPKCFPILLLEKPQKSLENCTRISRICARKKKLSKAFPVLLFKKATKIVPQKSIVIIFVISNFLLLKLMKKIVHGKFLA